MIYSSYFPVPSVYCKRVVQLFRAVPDENHQQKPNIEGDGVKAIHVQENKGRRGGLHDGNVQEREKNR